MVIRVALHTERDTDSDGNLNLLGLNRNDAGRKLNAYNGNPTNRWNRRNGFVFLAPLIFSFLSCFCGRVLFYDLSMPPTKLFARFFQWL